MQPQSIRIPFARDFPAQLADCAEFDQLTAKTGFRRLRNGRPAHFAPFQSNRLPVGFAPKMHGAVQHRQ